MSGYQADQWRRLWEQKRQSLLEEKCDRALEIHSFEDLQQCLRDLTAVHSRGSFPGILDKLNPSLRHIESFTGAISSAAQFEPVACLIWGSVQAVVQVSTPKSSMSGSG